MQKSISINLGYRKPFIAIIPNTNKGRQKQPHGKAKTFQYVG